MRMDVFRRMSPDKPATMSTPNGWGHTLAYTKAAYGGGVSGTRKELPPSPVIQRMLQAIEHLTPSERILLMAQLDDLSKYKESGNVSIEA